MGNPNIDGRGLAVQGGAIINKFYTSSAWIEGRAEDQLNQLATWAGVQEIAAFPDLHPGKYGPVGCAVLADRVYPQLIGNDIGCGMALFQLDLPKRKFKMEKALRRIRVLDAPLQDSQAARLEEQGLLHDLFATALGSLGGGNHFCEIQTLGDRTSACDLDDECMYLLIHSGSRGLGTATLNAVPQGGFGGMATATDAAQTYLSDHNQAVTWARLNRRIIAERAADALRADVRLIADVPHNVLAAHGDNWLHRKGAAMAQDMVPVAGSRATHSFLVQPLGHVDALGSLAHGAGRRYDRSSMHGRVGRNRSDLDGMIHTSLGGRVVCEDRDLLIEEAPLAYKSARSVVDDLQDTGVATRVATMTPVLTFKKTRAEGRR